MFDRISAGFRSASSCLDVLKADKRLVVFPLLSGLCALLVLASFAVPLAVLKPNLVQALDNGARINLPNSPIVYAVAFLFYFCNYFVIYFFNAALVHCALMHFRGLEAGPAEGLTAAGRCLPHLLAWSLVSATVGMLLKMVENANEKVGGIVSALLGAGWTVLTYFVVPVLVVEKVGPLDAVKRSGKILSRTWGEAIGGHAGIGWALLPFWLLGLLAVVGGVFAMTKAPVLGATLLVLAVVYFIVLGLVDATLKGILLAALYLYAKHGEVPAEFDRSALESSFTAKA